MPGPISHKALTPSNEPRHAPTEARYAWACAILDEALEAATPQGRYAAVLATFLVAAPQERDALFVETARRLVDMGAVQKDSSAPDQTMPHTDTVASVEDVAKVVQALYRPGGAAFTESLDLRLKALEEKHAELEAFVDRKVGRGSLEALIEMFEGPRPTWPQAMRTDAAARATEKPPAGLQPLTDAAASDMRATAAVYTGDR